MIYLDMDGVIADFFGGIETRFNVRHWKDLKWKEEVFAQLAYTDFFDTLPCFFDGKKNLSAKIVDHVKLQAFQNDIQWGICSSPMRGDETNSIYHKRVWLERMNFMPEVCNCIFTSNKHKYAMSPIDGRPNILIDDKPENIYRWEQAGGLGIRFQCNQDDIEEYLFEQLQDCLTVRMDG